MESEPPTAMESEPLPVIPDYFVGDIVAVTEYKKPNIGNKIGTKVLGGIARVTKVDTNKCDLNYYLEGRRVKDVPFEYMRRAPPSFGGSSPEQVVPTDNAGSSSTSSSTNVETDDLIPGSWEAQALRQAETLARAGSKRERKQITLFEAVPKEIRKQAKQTATSPKSAPATPAVPKVTKVVKPEKTEKPEKPEKSVAVKSTKSVAVKSTKNTSASTKAGSKAAVAKNASRGRGNFRSKSVDSKNTATSSANAIPTLPVLPRNTKAFKQGKWRKEPFDFRE